MVMLPNYRVSSKKIKIPELMLSLPHPFIQQLCLFCGYWHCPFLFHYHGSTITILVIFSDFLWLYLCCYSKAMTISLRDSSPAGWKGHRSPVQAQLLLTIPLVLLGLPQTPSVLFHWNQNSKTNFQGKCFCFQNFSIQEWNNLYPDKRR